MRISQNFWLEEFVPKHIFDTYGSDATKFVKPKLVDLAEFYKSFFTDYYKRKHPGKVKTVEVVINNWLWGGVKQNSGFRPPNSEVGAKLSQHKFCNAIDTELIIVFTDGKKQEVDYKEIHRVIADNHTDFWNAGLRCIEDVSIATGWLHSDLRWILNATRIHVVDLKDAWPI